MAGKSKKSGAVPRRMNRAVVLWIGSALMGLAAFGLAWGFQHLLVRARSDLLLRSLYVAYDRGMTARASDSVLEEHTGAPVVVVPITEQTNAALKALERSQLPAGYT